MTLKTYQGATMAEALANVKRDLGRDAVILQTRTLRKGGLFGIGGREVVEITASGDVNVMPRPVRRDLQRERSEALARMFGQSATPEAASEPAVGPRQCETEVTTGMKEELASIRTMVTDLVREARSSRMPELPEELFAAYLELLEGEVAEELARELIDTIRGELTGDQTVDRKRVREMLIECIGRMIPTAGPVSGGEEGQPRVVALVGPTGVGKTTTIAKLAANFKLREGKRVGLITIDTYRIAAVNQLATYAQIIDVPLKVVLAPAEARDAVAEFRKSCDIVLLDTAGRSPSDQMKLNELRGFLEAVGPHEVHLVLSSTCQSAAMRSAVERFSPLGVNRVILTKLDEAVSFGVVLEIIRHVNASLSYVTTGQDVPDDIEVGQASRLARWIIDRSISEQGPRSVDAVVDDRVASRSAGGEVPSHA